MPSPIENDWTLTKLLQNTYRYERSRFVYKLRDHVKGIKIEKVTVYDGRNPGEARTKYVIRTDSTPQYHPYFTKKDNRGRERSYQRKYHHQYQVVIQMDKLSMSVPFKGRVGADAKWDFSPAGASHKVGNRIIEGKNVLRGINGDFFFREEYLWQKEGILFGKCYAKGPPSKINPLGIIFAPKHFIAAVDLLMRAGVLSK